jgi:hypothetical protein
LGQDQRQTATAPDSHSRSAARRNAMRDFRSKQDCPNEETVAKTWCELREQPPDKTIHFPPHDFGIGAD